MLKDMQDVQSEIKTPVFKEVSLNKNSFSQVLDKALTHVNALQSTSETLQNSYELGDDKVSIAEVMMASQKANLSFQALVQVRNKLVSAYKEIMNMPV
jgi:flagellar hook-basal body complex protein FliE